jgi:peptidoglycan/LPS O-acetylase OafA/YrhL
MKIESLNGIRGFAVILVLLSHASNAGVNLQSNLIFSGAGRYGVFLFFILSSFLLTRQFIEISPKGNQIKPFITHYLLRRFLRIYPLFLASLALYYVLDKFGMGIYELSEMDLAKAIFLLDGKGVFWTIPVEFQYYFILPVIALIFLRVRSTLFAVIATTLFVAVWWMLFPPKYVPYLMPFLPIFVIGSGAAFISNRISFYYSQTNDKKILMAFNFFAICAFITFFIFIPNYFNIIFSRNVGQARFHEQFLLFSILSCILVLCVVHGNGFIKKLMESRFLVFWGNVSFSAYLGHLVVLKFIKMLEFPAPIQWILFISVTALMSYLAFRYFEMPLSKIHKFRSLYMQVKIASGITKKSG